MYVCMYVCMFVCLFVRLYVCMYVYICTYMCVHSKIVTYPIYIARRYEYMYIYTSICDM